MEQDESECWDEQKCVLSERTEETVPNEQTQRNEQASDQHNEVHEIILIWQIGGSFVHVIGQVTDHFGERISPNEIVDQALCNTECY